jgi:hypothetical protein
MAIETSLIDVSTVPDLADCLSTTVSCILAQDMEEIAESKQAYLAGPNLSKPAWSWFTVTGELQRPKEAG